MVIYSTLVRTTSGVNLPSHLDPSSQVTAALNRYRDALKNPVYSNDWAVEVDGGQEVADEIASAQGFINMGKVAKAFAPRIMHALTHTQLTSSDRPLRITFT